MEMFLAKVFGSYFIIAGAIALFRRGAVMPAVSQLAQNKPLILLLGVAELFAGLLIVIAYPNITFDYMGLITLIGWMLIVESIIYLATPSKEVQRFIKSFNTPLWYTAGGVIAILLGVYLVNVGFSLGFF